MFFVWITIVITAVESVIKQVIEQKYLLGQTKEAAKGKILITRYHNRGACLNLFDKSPLFVKGLSVGITGICILLFLATFGTKGKKLLKTGLAILLGGAFSNTYDRLVRNYVVDYVQFKTPFVKLNSVVFNISDFCIMIGAMIIAFAM